MMRVLFAALLLIMLTGCWDRRETNELGIVHGLALDYKDGLYQATAEVVNTKAVTRPGKTTSGAGARQPESVLETGHGRTVESAIADLGHVASRHMFYPSMRVLAIGEGLARHGITDLEETLPHFPGIRLTPIVVVSHGEAKNLLVQGHSGNEIDASSELRLLARVEHQDESDSRAPRIYEFLRKAHEPGRAMLVMGVGTGSPVQSRGQTYRLTESAVIDGDRLVAWMPRQYARMVLWMTNHVIRSDFNLRCPDGQGTTVVRIRHAGARRRVHVKDGMVQGADVTLSADAVLLTPGCNGGTLSSLSQMAASEALQDAMTTIAWTKTHRADLLGFGMLVNEKDPALWRRMAPHWPEDLQKIPVHLSVQINIRAVGPTV